MQGGVFLQDITNAQPDEKRRTAVALGLFDGVHRGHAMIIGEAVRAAKKMGISSAVFCFNTETVTSKGENGRLEMLSTSSEKASRISDLDVDMLYSPDFESMKSLEPEAFVRDVLKGVLGCEYAVCGTDYSFGKGAKGKAKDLEELGEKYGIKVNIMDQLLCGGSVISSTEIRKLIKEGKIAAANEMLGYTYGYRLKVEHGYQRGRTWNFPTINQRIPDGLVLPRFGVYCSKVLIDGKWYSGVTNIGVKPTVHVETAPLAETYIIDYEGDLYEKDIELRLYEFVRPERLFGSFDELKAEIGRNTEFTRKYFSER